MVQALETTTSITVNELTRKRLTVMKLFSKHLVVWGLAIIGAGQAYAESDVIVFAGVNVVPMSSAHVTVDQTVVVRGERITAMGPSAQVEIPSGATVLESSGRFLMPGLAEMHAHVPSVVNPQFLQDVLFLYVANGITTARGMLGQPPHLKLRERISKHEIIAPRLITSGPSLNGNSVDGPENAREIVKAQAAAGYDFVKVHPGLSKEEFDAAVEAGQTYGIDLAGHVTASAGLIHVLESGQVTVDHLDGYVESMVPESKRPSEAPGFFGVNWAPLADPAGLEDRVRRTADAQAWVVPTQSLLEHVVLPTTVEQLLARDGNRYMPRRSVQNWANTKRQVLDNPDYDADEARRFIDLRRRLISALDRDDRLLLGSDAPQIFNVPGFSIHHELRSLEASGLTPYRALRTGTVNVARFLGEEETTGQVAEGFVADLVLVSENPLEQLETLRRPLGVMVRGRWLDRESLDTGLAQIAARHQ